MTEILLDTGIGGDIDDALCLAYLLREPRCQRLSIRTVCGEPETRAAVADAAAHHGAARQDRDGLWTAAVQGRVQG